MAPPRLSGQIPSRLQAPRLNQPDLLAHNSSLTHSGWSPGEDGQGEETAIPPIVGRNTQGGTARQVGALEEVPSGRPSPREHPADAGDQTSPLPPLCHPGPGCRRRLPAVTAAVSPPASALISVPLHAPASACGLCSNNAHDCGLWCLTRVFHSTLQICILYCPDITPQKLQSSHRCKNLISRGHTKPFSLKSVFPNINV